MERIIRIASKELGIHESPGTRENPRITKYAKDTGMPWINEEDTPWCSIFMNWVAQKAGFESSGSAMARSWLDVGINVDSPEPGDIVVLSRDEAGPKAGHVAVFMGYSKTEERVYYIGGNQSDAVTLSGNPINRVLGYRRLRRLHLRLPTASYGIGAKGLDIALIQDALKMAGYNCGTSDGDFGPRTRAAITMLQQESGGRLVVNGEYDTPTRDFIRHLIAQNS